MQLNVIEQQRYIRQMTMPEVGEAGQLKLKNARILVVGAGGLATSLLPSLVGSGIGYIRLYDADVVDVSNLHRQTLYRMQDIGQAKVAAAQQHLMQLNPYSMIEPRQQHVHSANIHVACDEIDLVVDAADRFATTYLLSNYCKAKKIPLVSASVLLQKGYVGGFCGLNAPSYSAVFPQLPQSAMSCAISGVLPSSVAVIASLQAQMVLNIILGLQPSALGQLLHIDLSHWHLQSFRFDTAPESEDALSWLDEYQIQPEDIVLDLRHPDEVQSDVATQVQYVQHADLDHMRFDGQQRIICACASGIRAAKAAQVLKQRGYQNLYILAAL